MSQKERRIEITERFLHMKAVLEGQLQDLADELDALGDDWHELEIHFMRTNHTLFVMEALIENLEGLVHNPPVELKKEGKN